MTGHIRRRGEHSWEIKFDLGRDPKTGKRLTRYHSFKGTKRQAEAELTRLKASADRGAYVDQSRTTVAEFLTRWISDWAKLHLSKKTSESYEGMITAHIIPRIGASPLQKLRPGALAELYAELLKEGRKAKGKNKGLSPRTVEYAHTILHRALGHAVTWGLIVANPAEAVDPPKVNREEIVILTEQQVKDVLAKLRGKTLGPIAVLGLATGLRRGEMLALRWSDIDLDAGRLRVERSLEETKNELRFKSPKTKHGRRTVSFSASVTRELRALKKAQSELRLKLGQGKEPDDSLIFRQIDGRPLIPHSVTTAWRRCAAEMNLTGVTLHAWRHTHVSQLIASGMDVLTISRRIGHASPAITLNVYGHLFHPADDRAASVFETAFGGMLGE